MLSPSSPTNNDDNVNWWLDLQAQFFRHIHLFIMCFLLIIICVANIIVYLFLPDWQDTQGDDKFYRNNINRYLILFFPYFLGINICAFIYAFLLSKKFVKRWGALEVLDQNATSASNDETNCKLQAKRKGANNFSVTLEHVISSLSWDEL
mmetsp:Transcript_4445/g.6084  ORF Transcript_4445/g.6084 Transcript_4445/m.6084 type:complete len:150 (-) Transcript_4445:283-732(-)